MAHFMKLSAADARKLARHCRRENTTASRSRIDKNRTQYNQVGDKKYGGDPDAWLAKNKDVHCMQRADIKKAISFVVTLPHDVRSGDETLFLKTCMQIIKKDTTFASGRNSIIGAYLHVDETRIHLHMLFVPVVADRRGGYKVCAKEWLTKPYLKSFHDRLSNEVAKELGYRVNVCAADATERLNAHDNIKNITSYRESKEKELRGLESAICELKTQISALQQQKQELEDDARLKRANRILENVYSRADSWDSWER